MGFLAAATQIPKNGLTVEFNWVIAHIQRAG